jgi:hypothetical protein
MAGTQRSRVRHLVALVVTLGLFGGVARAQTHAVGVPCPDPRIAVTAEDPALASQACAAVARARPILADCQLVQTEPLSISIVPAITALGNSAHCMAIYDCAEKRLTVLTPTALAQNLDPQSVLARIPVDDLFASLIAHELTHAFYLAAIGGATQDRANHEYAAYAMQFATLPPAARAELLTANPGPGKVTTDELNAMILAMAPAVFAAKVWRHFAAEGNGCAFVAKLIRGEVTLALAPL